MYHYANYFERLEAATNGKLYVGGHQMGPDSHSIHKLVSKASACVSEFSLNLKKCCNHFEDYKLEMEACRGIGDGKHRKLCRQGVRTRYAYN